MTNAYEKIFIFSFPFLPSFVFLLLSFFFFFFFFLLFIYFFAFLFFSSLCFFCSPPSFFHLDTLGVWPVGVCLNRGFPAYSTHQCNTAQVCKLLLSDPDEDLCWSMRVGHFLALFGSFCHVEWGHFGFADFAVCLGVFLKEPCIF